jgi:hypothetical protein
MTAYERMGCQHGSQFANMALQVIRDSKGQCDGATWDAWLNARIATIHDELRRFGATPEQIDQWYGCLVNTYQSAMSTAEQIVNAQVLAQTEPAGRA